ncbi:aminoacyl-tRNA hydrolase [Corynebacterium lizhenjunii]|uniref:Peptidyl-tRNA hydrolase n=1 Tax=Corynebacterium lizhenjunii TaxID=2709394 RepID=A0A7T0KFJ5_9CORY|nr:aminoacyl-tRNA hydrolase [Corynebacterium lizhenjunii]QPK79850.1 aminoacyl-tRNA hydrolase [Corynebacterium lizhenjunii]
MSFLRDFLARFSRPRSTNAARPSGVDPADLTADFLVVGLGNPGPQYAATRHNVGYMALDDLLAAHGAVLEPVRGIAAHAAQLNLDGVHVVAARSTDYMNVSGEGIGQLARHLGIAAERVIILHDELDLPAHKLRLKLGGNENGHNGLKSISEHLGTRDYLRVRIGISRPAPGTPVPDYVLGPVDAGAGFDESIAGAAHAATLLATRGLAAAQQEIHPRFK